MVENKGLLTEKERRDIWVSGDGTLEAISKAQRNKTLAKFREVVEGAELTDGEIKLALKRAYDFYVSDANRPIKVLRECEDLFLLEVYKQAILKAMGD